MPSNFHYWVPKNPPAAAPAKKTAKGAATAAATKFPARFPDDFSTLTTSPLDATHTLATTPTITQNEVARAAFETGYGPKKDWPSTLLMSGVERTALAAFLNARVEWIVSTFHFTNGQIVPQQFSRYVETSEWSTVSYYMGQIAARLAADRWLPPNRLPGTLLHQAIFTSATFVRSKGKVSLKVASKKVPDLLVEDATSKWHLFEAKGGRTNYRSNAVIKALDQLDAVTHIGRTVPLKAPASRVCTFAKLNRPQKTAKAIEFDIVDPPDKETSDDGLEILVEVAALLTASLQFDILDTLAKPARMPEALEKLALEADIRQIGRSNTYLALPGRALIDAFVFEIAVYQHVRRRVDTRGGFDNLLDPQWIDEMLRTAAQSTLRTDIDPARIDKARMAIQASLDQQARREQRPYKVLVTLVANLGVERLHKTFETQRLAFTEGLTEKLPPEATRTPPLPGQGGAVFFSYSDEPEPEVDRPPVRNPRRQTRSRL